MLRFRAVVEPRITPAVVDVGAGLPTGSSVHVDHDIEAGLTRPFHDAVEQPEPVCIVALKILVVDGNANRIEAHALEKLNVIARNVAVDVFAPDLPGSVRPEKFVRERFDLTCRLWASFEMKHVAFTYQPVAEVRATEA